MAPWASIVLLDVLFFELKSGVVWEMKMQQERVKGLDEMWVSTCEAVSGQ
jgi:hypothetical protein